VFYTALDSIAAKIEEEDALVVFEKALENVLLMLKLDQEELEGQLSKFLIQ
jgi:ribosomal protein S7